MASSVIHNRFKVTELQMAIGSLTWGSSGAWYATYNNWQATGKILSVAITNWSGLAGVTIPYIDRQKIAFMASAKPTASGSMTVRIVEEV